LKRALPTAALLLLVLAPWASAGPDAGAEPKRGTTYAPVPPGIASVVGDERDDALAAMALATLERGDTQAALSRALLVLLEDVGLKAAAKRLAQGDVPAHEMAQLLEVVAASEHPDADLLLARAAHEARPLLRMIAADGLGRGRSPRAVPALRTLTRDGVPGVRIAALRSLFAIESPQAVAARIAAPPDAIDELLARRLDWHHRSEDVSPALREIATRAYTTSRSIPLRLAAARYLTLPRVNAPVDTLETIIREMGQGPFFAALVRRGLGVPLEGYDLATMRRIVIAAVLTLLGRPDQPPERRKRWIERAVWWVARPVAMDPYRSDPIPENVLRRRLPDFGAEIVEAVVRRLAAGQFNEPRQGVILLRELGPDLALPPLRAFLAPRKERPPFESHAEAGQRRYLRSAAAGALDELGRIGDEALARRLLFGDEERALKIDILHAVGGEDAPWVVPLLAEILHGEDANLRSYAITLLEGRAEPEARTLLVDDLFQRAERPHDRMQPLVQRGDDAAFEVLERALKDERASLRKAALAKFHRRKNRRLMGSRSRALLRSYTPRPRSTQEIQAYVSALLSVEPVHAVTWVRTQWDALPDDAARRTMLRLLGEARGKKARERAIDLALEKAGPKAPRSMLLTAASVFMGPAAEMRDAGYEWTYRVADVGSFWQRLLHSEDAALQRDAVAAYTRADAPHPTKRLLVLLDRALAGKALAEDDTTPVGEQGFAQEVIAALAFSPWADVESKLIDIATDPLLDTSTRRFAAQWMMGRLSAAGRQRIIGWLEYTKPSRAVEAPAHGSRGFHAPREVQLFLAAAVGEGGGEETAGILFAALKRELFEFYRPEVLRRLLEHGPSAVSEWKLRDRAVPLARGISRTRHVPSILAMLDLVFDLRFALYARVCAQRQAEVAHAANASAAASTPSPLAALAHDDGTPYWGMPLALHDILYEVKILDDDVLAAGFTHVLEVARADGRLAQFPELFMYRVHTNLLEPHTGRKPKTAAVVRRLARKMGPPDSAIHYFLFARGASELARAGRFADAANEQRGAVRILARGSHDDQSDGLWALQRAALDALEGASAKQRGEAERANAFFRQATLRGPNDPNILNTVAWWRAVADAGLEEAEREAVHATTLEARLENRPTPNAADTLAYVLLKRGRAHAGLRVLGPRMQTRTAAQDGLFHYHMAQLYAAAKQWRSARDALVQALTWDRVLLATAHGEPRFRPLFEKQSLAEIEKLASAKRTAEDLPP